MLTINMMTSVFVQVTPVSQKFRQNSHPPDIQTLCMQRGSQLEENLLNGKMALKDEELKIKI